MQIIQNEVNTSNKYNQIDFIYICQIIKSPPETSKIIISIEMNY